MLGSDLGGGMEKEKGECCTAEWGCLGKKGRNDLKIGPERPSSSTFERTSVRSTALVPGASGATGSAFELTR
jgi:hypothetical protein